MGRFELSFSQIQNMITNHATLRCFTFYC